MIGINDVAGMYAQLPLCIAPGSHYFQLDHINRDTAVCTRCGLIRRDSARTTSFRKAVG